MNFKYFTKRGRLGQPLFVAEKYRISHRFKSRKEMTILKYHAIIYE